MPKEIKSLRDVNPGFVPAPPIKPIELVNDELVMLSFTKQKGQYGEFYLCKVEDTSRGATYSFSTGEMGVASVLDGMNSKTSCPFAFHLRALDERLFLDD